MSTLTQAQVPEQDLQEICEYDVSVLIDRGPPDSDNDVSELAGILLAEADWDATQWLSIVGSVGTIFSSAR